MTPWVTRLVFANAGVFLLQGLLPDGTLDRLVLVPSDLLVQPWTAVTYTLLHGGLMHIFFNMFMLIIFGPRVEERLGGNRFITLYVLSGLGGALLSLITPNVAIIGASGAIFGIMYGFAHYWPDARIMIFPIFIPIPVRLWILILVGLDLLSGVRGAQSGIAHFAHLGGFIGAILFLRWVDRNSGARRFKAQSAPAPVRPSAADRRRWEQIPRNDLHPLNKDELDRVLDKIGQGGLESLTGAEREFLERFSRH